MIDKESVRKVVEKSIEGTDIFLVDLRIDSNNRIVVELDSEKGMDINTCAKITKEIEAQFDRDKEDYELEVGSVGLTAPFKVKQQYMKNLGKEIEVIKKDGTKLKGVLTSVNAGDYIIEVKEKKKLEGSKRSQIVTVPYTINYDETKTAKYIFHF